MHHQTRVMFPVVHRFEFKFARQRAVNMSSVFVSMSTWLLVTSGDRAFVANGEPAGPDWLRNTIQVTGRSLGDVSAYPVCLQQHTDVPTDTSPKDWLSEADFHYKLRKAGQSPTFTLPDPICARRNSSLSFTKENGTNIHDSPRQGAASQAVASECSAELEKAAIVLDTSAGPTARPRCIVGHLVRR